MNKSYYEFAKDLVYTIEQEQIKCNYRSVSVDFFEDFEALSSLAKEKEHGMVNLLNQALGYYFDLFPRTGDDFSQRKKNQIRREEKEALLSVLLEMYDEDADEPA